MTRIPSTRVVVTGLGVITSAGIGKKSLINVLKKGTSCINRIDTFNTDDLASKIGASVKGFKDLEFLERKYAKRLDRAGQFFVALCRMALDDADLENIDPFRTGICEGTSLGGIPHALVEQEKFFTSNSKRINPLIAIRAMTGAAGSIAAIIHNIKGPVSATSNGSVSSASALMNAYNHVQQNQADVILAGGAEAPLVRQMFQIFCAAGMLSKNWNTSPQMACRPFDCARDGMILGEGGAVLVLENLEHAKERGARIYAELAGISITNDAFSTVAPERSPNSKVVAIKNVLKQAKINADDIDFISAHGTSTRLNDPIETKAIKTTFGQKAYEIPMSSVKSMIGHTLGACTAVEVVTTLMGMENSFVPPTINLNNPDPECDLDYVPINAREQEINIALINNSGFGGRNSSILLKKWNTLTD